MTTTHPSRNFKSGEATTLYVTIPAQIVADSQSPFERDETVTVTLEDNRLVISPATEETDE